ncbi:sugar ABC transporter, partial [Brucella anthropi]
MMRKYLTLMLSTIAISVISFGSARADETSVCLVTKTENNPFFVKMKEGATAKAAELGMKLLSYAGKAEGDVRHQISAIESCIAAGAKGILLVPNDSSALVPVVKQAREQGVLVVALDTPLAPADAADAIFATDNFKAGVLIGEWAKGRMGEKASDAKIALLNLNAQQITVDYMRNQGFMSGFGIDIKDKTRIGDEDDSRIVGNEASNSNEEGGRTAMESLLQVNPEINLVYTINEPAAAGAHEAIKAAGLEDQITIVSIDGGCPGVNNVKQGIIG